MHLVRFGAYYHIVIMIFQMVGIKKRTDLSEKLKKPGGRASLRRRRSPHKVGRVFPRLEPRGTLPPATPRLALCGDVSGG